MSKMLRWSEGALSVHLAKIGRVAPGRIIKLLNADAPIRRVPTPEAEKRSKHGATANYVEGERFDSKLEARIWQELKLRQAAGEIRNLRRQVKFSLFGNGGEHIGTYTADYVFEESRHNGWTIVWERVVGDAKSAHTRELPAWKRTKKLMLACHGVNVREMP